MQQKLLVVLMALIVEGCVIGTKDNDATTQPPDIAPDRNVSGSYFTLQGEKVNESTLHGTDLNTVKIEGKTFSLPLLKTQNGLYELPSQSKGGKSYQRYIVSDDKYRQTRFGFIEENGKFYLFNQGYVTLDMPKSGAFVYRGQAAVFLNSGQYFGMASALSAVDFGKKSVSIKITTVEAQPREINFNATIHGNTFSGDKGAISDGGFYGKNAAELSGRFLDKQNNFGTFGGQKTEDLK